MTSPPAERSKPIRRVLVPNRGEIALRIVRGLRAAGVQAIVAHSDADEHSPAVRAADDAIRLGPPPAAESYLNSRAILGAAAHTKVDAIHPGYGFLSESSTFARDVEASGLVFLGPTPEQIETLGDKTRARAALKRIGAPPVPGSTGAIGDADSEEARRVVERWGFPLLIKAAAGGGGRGQRVVRSAKDFAPALRDARAEAELAFGSSLVFVERYLEGARHIEIQVLGDGRGGALVFPERDCSVQRRHQKVLEESPGPTISSAVRERLQGVAFELAHRHHYRGPGTLEFLVTPNGEAYFLEMNTRLQVEHPVTEAITARDFVADHLFVAEGGTLPRGANDSAVDGQGAAIEFRVLAEDTHGGFRPAVGRVLRTRWPGGPGVRVDAGVWPGSEVTAHYDSLLAKIIAHGRDRAQALERLRIALDETALGGVPTTIGFGRALCASAAVARGHYDTGWLERSLESGALRQDPATLDDDTAAAILALVRSRRQDPAARIASGPRLDAWRSRALRPFTPEAT